MKPKMQSAIEKITLNDATFTGEVIEPTFVNFFYGKNGAGKSTIARAIHDNTGIEWQNGKTATDYDLLTYNTEFIDANFANYGNLAGVFTVCETNIEVQKKIEALQADKGAAEEEHKKKSETAELKRNEKEGALEVFQEACWNQSKGRRTTFDAAIKGKKTKALFAGEILKITPVQHDEETLEKMAKTLWGGDDKQYVKFSKGKKVSYASLPGFDLMGKVVASSSETPFAGFIKRLNATDWVRQGHTHFAGQTDGKCPYCQQKLPSTFEDDLLNCFDAQYQEDITAINNFKTVYESEMNGLINTFEGNLDGVMPGLDTSEYETKIKNFKDAIVINSQRIASKIKEPTTIASLEDTDSILLEIGSIIDQLNSQIDAHNTLVGDKKNQQSKCSKEVWEYLSFTLKEAVKKYNDTLANADKELKTLKIELGDLEKKSRNITNEISDLNKQVVNTEATIEGINRILKTSGFQGFSLRAKKSVQNTYEVIRPDGSIAEKLSEGERNFIAFLYFYHLVRGSFSDKEVKDKVVVIDDPVSSMDSSALLIVSALVREMVEICLNNTDYLNQKIEGNFIKQIFILTHNVYFHNEITPRQVNKYRSTSFYLIRKTDNVSRIKLCVRPSHTVPTEEENYNPIQNSYAALWDEYKELKTVNTITNVVHHILEYYFIQICGYAGADLQKIVLDDNKDRFVDHSGSKPDYTKHELAAALLSYIDSSPALIADGFNIIETGFDVEQIKDVFKMIFEAMQQEQHYKMMMNADED